MTTETSGGIVAALALIGVALALILVDPAPVSLLLAVGIAISAGLVRAVVTRRTGRS
jgi:hypothetical protein